MKKQEKRILAIAKIISKAWGISLAQCIQEVKRTLDFPSKCDKIGP